MVKIKGGKINAVSAEKKTSSEMQGMSVNVDVQEVHFRNDDVQVVYEYTFSYEPNLATIKVKGELFLDPTKDERKNFEEMWKKNKQIPVPIAEEVLSALAYTATSVGTLLAYSINVPAPLNLPRINLQQAANPMPSGKKTAG